jgi:hypothetical protein
LTLLGALPLIACTHVQQGDTVDRGDHQMKKTVTFARLLALFLATTLQPASAAMLIIDLNQAFETCTKDMSPVPTECPLPTLTAGGITVDDFITLSSPNGASLYSDSTDTVLALTASSGASQLIADITFDITRALVTEISFTAGEPASLGCTVFEATMLSPDCSGDSNPITIISSSYILGLRLGSLENFAHDINVTYTAVPLPAAAVLFISGLAGLAGFTMRRERSLPRM